MGEVTYRGEPPFHLPTTQAASVRGDNGTVEVTVFASVEGKGPADFPVRLGGMSVPEARQLIADLGHAILEAQQQPRIR
ncbi:MAG: hypothetical protein ABSA90_06320 [Xanthobacteraceae bacterium]|jgi:hypothetical protein